MNKQRSNKKIFFQQQEIENTLLCAREVMDMTARFLCSFLKHLSNHEKQNLIYSLALSYAQMEQQINETLEINFFEQPKQTTSEMIILELKKKLEMLTEEVIKQSHN